MIRSFADRDAEQVFRGQRSRKFDSIAKIALRKLEMLNAAEALDDLLVPPGNRLEALKAERQGQYSIRINNQWRICFVWHEGGPMHVEIVDYHG